jgi:glycosyltransferase involved in cell wall biosynthesis
VREASAWAPVSARAQALLVELGADPARCFPVPNAPDADRFARARADPAAREATRREHGVAPGEPVTCFVGRLVAAKAVGVLLDAARRLRPDVPVTWVVGGGALRRRLEASARRSGLHPRVRFLGERGYEDVVRLLAAADVVVLPSVHEPYGVALHEGMAAGCAALASDAVGAAELVEEGASGHVVPAGDPAALAAAWRDLLADPARLAERGRRAQARALERGLPFAAESLERATAAAIAHLAGPAPAKVAR